MQYLISFLEGIVTFISPCLLPMLPIYLSYFAAGERRSAARTFCCALGFVLGFTAVFVAMGALAGTLGSFLVRYKAVINVVLGAIMVLFGLNFMGVFQLNLFRGLGLQAKTADMNFPQAVVFGVVFSVGWTPCVGTFLGSALMLAGQQGSTMVGMGMLLCYSLGLGLPFLLSALLLDQLKKTFDFIKRSYRVINILCGGLLVLVGVLMAAGQLDRIINFLR